MIVRFRHQVTVNEQFTDAIFFEDAWPNFLVVPQIGDMVNEINRADPLAAIFTVDARTINMETPPFVTLTMFHEAEPGETTRKALERIGQDFPGWEFEEDE